MGNECRKAGCFDYLTGPPNKHLRSNQKFMYTPETHYTTGCGIESEEVRTLPLVQDCDPIVRTYPYKLRRHSEAPIKFATPESGSFSPYGELVMSGTRRKSSISLPFVKHKPEQRKSSGFSHTETVLTDEGKHYIRRSWKLILEKNGKNQPGILIYQKVFAMCPDLRPLFSIPVELPLEKLHEVANFSRHAGVFCNLIDLVVRNIFELDSEVSPILQMYGRRHYCKHHIVFQPELMNVFAQGLCKFFEDQVDENPDALSEETKTAWNILVLYIVRKITEGNSAEILHGPHGSRRKFSTVF